MTAGKAPSRSRVAARRADARTQRPGRRRAARAQPAASAVAWRCMVLAVDTAARSGWTVVLGGASQTEWPWCYGEADTLDAGSLAHIVRWSVCHAAARGVPLVLVLEAPFGGPMRTLLALGAARERWLVAWREAVQPRSRVVTVQPAEWRARVLGPRWAKAPRAEVRAHEQVTAGAMVGERVRGDEAAAILIGTWALRAAKVGAVLPRRGIP